ncbi:MAG: BatA domain-containing protein [Pirellulaceae bacterium]|nr:BatA domain-containing protein [Pirellulaceae bacterium]
MSFLNWILLGGVAAFSAPLIIHLLNRTRFKVVEWGAMHLLDAALQVNSQRIQWQSLLLLLMRCLIPILLALGLARPVLTSWQTAGGAGDKSLVLLIDNSISMQAIGASGTTRFQQALLQAQAIIKQQAPSTELSLWALGGQPVDVLKGTTFDHARVANKLEALAVGAGSLDVQSSLATAIKQASAMQNASREVIILSDFQDHEWKTFSESERAAIKQQLAAEKTPIQLTFLPVREPIAKVNLSVTLEPPEQPLVVVDQIFRVSAQVRNHGDQPAESVSIVLEVAGTEVASRKIAIPPNGTTQAVFDCQIESPGTHVINVTLKDEKGLAGDNTSNCIVQVRTPIKVLLVDKQASAPELKRSTGYLSLSLSPFQASDAAGKNNMLTRVIHPDQLTRSEITDHDVVVIGDASRLNDKTADDIAAFVRGGGGLLIFSANGIDKNWYNARWGAASKTPLLPADYLLDAKPLAKVAHISDELSTHASLVFFKQLGIDDLPSIEVKSVLGLKLSPSSDSAELASQVLLKLDSAERLLVAPLLVAKPFGAGNVLQFAIAADTSDTNLPLRPMYVPLMQGLVQWLAIGTDTVRNSTTGQALSIKMPAVAEDKNTKPTDHTVLVTLPDRSQAEERFDQAGQLSFGKTAFPGVYSVSWEGLVDPQAMQLENYAVNAPVEESELQFLTQPQLSEIASATGASVAADVQELLTMQSLRADGREVWRWFLLALVALLFVELWWQQRITRGPL